MRGGKLGIGKLVVGVLLLTLLAVTVQAQGAGVLEGQVVNGTADGPEIGAGLTVTLRVLQGDAEVDSLETTTDTEGRFRFEGLDTDPTLEYWPEAIYLDVTYPSSKAYQFDGKTTLSATLTVYETTDDDSAIRLSSAHMIAESFEQVLRISEIHLYSNTGDRTFVGSDGATIRISLPEGAVGLAFGEGTREGRFAEVDGGLTDSEPVPPGSESALVFFSYHLLVSGEAIPLERSFPYPVGTLNVLAAQPGLTLRSDQLLSRGIQSFQGLDYEFHTVQGLEAETPLVMELVPLAGAGDASGAPPTSEEEAATAPTRGNQGTLFWIGIALAGMAVIGAGIFPLVTRRPARARASTPNLAANPATRRLLVELAELEEAFEAGDIDEAGYDRRRAELYGAIKSL